MCDSGSFMVKVYTVLPTKKNAELKPLGSIVATTEDMSWWQIQVHQSCLYVGSDIEGGFVWDFESGRYIPVPAFQQIGEVDHVSKSDILAWHPPVDTGLGGFHG